MINSMEWGYQDYKQGIPITDSPYLEDSLAHEQWVAGWLAGWLEAQDESLVNSLTDNEKSDKINK